MEEASIAAVNGELSPMTTGVTACRMIGACRDMTDYRRASEWIEATEKYCDRQSLSGFPGVCRIHRAEVAAVGGAWDRAEQELERATIELAPTTRRHHRPTGSTRSATSVGCGATSKALSRRSAKRMPAAGRPSRRSLSSGSPRATSRPRRARSMRPWPRRPGIAGLGPGCCRRRSRSPSPPVMSTGARTAVDELGEIVADYPSPAFESGRQVALARVLLAEGDASGAIRELRAAIKGWRDVGAPYEVARARAILSRALRAIDDDDGADLELEAAIASFVQLGARIDLEAAERELRDARGSPQRTVRPPRRRSCSPTSSARRTSPRPSATRPGRRVLRKHDDMLRRMVAGGGGEVVNSTGDGFFVAFDGAREAIDCAIGIQRALRDLRASVGFACAGADRTPHSEREPARQPITAGRASTSRPGSPRSPRAARSWPARRRSRRRGASRPRNRGPSTVKGVAAPVDLRRRVTWS